MSKNYAKTVNCVLLIYEKILYMIYFYREFDRKYPKYFI